MTGVVLPKHRSAHVTATVAKAAAGAVEYLAVALVPAVPSALTDSAERRCGPWPRSGRCQGARRRAVLSAPVALVLGAEGDWSAALTRARCDVMARIDLLGGLESLNVAAAGAVACFAVARARRLSRS